jgi:hypothetical protein
MPSENGSFAGKVAFLCGRILAQEMQSPFVRRAELEIDPARLEKLGRPLEKQDI